MFFNFSPLNHCSSVIQLFEPLGSLTKKIPPFEPDLLTYDKYGYIPKYSCPLYIVSPKSFIIGRIQHLPPLIPSNKPNSHGHHFELEIFDVEIYAKHLHYFNLLRNCSPVSLVIILGFNSLSP